jgi:DNA primase
MPLRWSEVNSRLDVRRFTIENVVTRMKKLKSDPLREVLTTTPDLSGALEQLAQRG